jgi:hypothetical protein
MSLPRTLHYANESSRSDHDTALLSQVMNYCTSLDTSLNAVETNVDNLVKRNKQLVLDETDSTTDSVLYLV